MNKLNNQIIAGDIYERLYWYVNYGGLASVNMTFKLNYYYKLSNNNREAESCRTICDGCVNSLEDFYKIIELVEENTDNDIQKVKEQAIIDVRDFSKDLYILVKLREE